MKTITRNHRLQLHDCHHIHYQDECPLCCGDEILSLFPWTYPSGALTDRANLLSPSYLPSCYLLPYLPLIFLPVIIVIMIDTLHFFLILLLHPPFIPPSHTCSPPSLSLPGDIPEESDPSNLQHKKEIEGVSSSRRVRGDARTRGFLRVHQGTD